MNSPDATIDRLVATVKQLHSLPAVAMEVLALTSNPTVDTRALKTCIENDPALTVKLLRVVNSSLFGLSREVSDLNQALALLGTKPLRLLVLGFSLPAGLFEGIEAEILGRYWRHTLTKAVAAREISETIWKQPGDEAFIAGLLQDLAELLLIQELGEPYARLLEKAHSAGRDTLALEAQAMGFDHTELTARLLDHWGLPPTLANAVRWDPAGQGEEASPGPLREQRRILHLAELLARVLADGRRDVLPELLAAGRNYHAISPSQLDALVDRLEDKVLQLANVLSLQLPGQLDYHDILVRAHAQLADIALSAAGDLIVGERSTAEDDSLSDELQLLSDAAQRVGRAPAARRVVESKPAVVLPANAPVEPTFHAAGGTSVAAPSRDCSRRLEAVVAACRQSRCPLSLLLVELSNADELVLKIGLEGVHEACRAVESLCRHVDQRYSLCLPHGDFAFALILADCDRQTAVRLGNQLIRQVGRSPSANPPDGHWTAQVSVGVATVALPPRNFPAHDLIDGASRCLYGSHASGGGVVKSIEIY